MVKGLGWKQIYTWSSKKLTYINSLYSIKQKQQKINIITLPQYIINPNLPNTLQLSKKMQKSQLDLLNPSTKSKMIIKTVTWLKDSHQLFDYEFTKNIVKQEFTISLEHSFVFFYRSNAKSEIIFVKKAEMVPSKIEGVQLIGCFQIVSSGGPGNGVGAMGGTGYTSMGMSSRKFKLLFHDANQFEYPPNKMERLGTEVSNSSGQNRNQNIYFIVRSLKDGQHEPKGFILKTGQKIKFGRIQYNVTVVKHKNQDKNADPPKFFQYEQTLELENKKYDESEACKICLSNEQSEPYSFFCTPCDCQGSCSIVHFDCLFQWCKTKVKKDKIGKIMHYNFQKFECQICKKYFPRFILRNKIKHDLLPIDRPECDYLVLSSNKNQTQTQKSLIMINYSEQNVLKIGRNQTCDIRIVDISVSRQHASIETRNGEFQLYDSKSKFGTIVCEPAFGLELEKIKRGIQVGRTVLTFQLADRHS